LLVLKSATQGTMIEALQPGTKNKKTTIRNKYRMEYKFRDIEKKWQQWWKENNVYKVDNISSKAQVLCA